MCWYGDIMNYPRGFKFLETNDKEKVKNLNIRYDNRGMNLESDINISNQYYIDIKKAFIYKKPTPIQITKVDYKKMVIKEAFFKEPSTTDYNGLYKGRYIDFEAKETNSKTSFPLSNIHKHQIAHIENVVSNGGIGFLIVRFTMLQKTYLLMGEDFINFLEGNERKSIPLSFFEEKGFIINDSYVPRLDYLKVIDKIIGGTYNGKKEEK